MTRINQAVSSNNKGFVESMGERVAAEALFQITTVAGRATKTTGKPDDKLKKANILAGAFRVIVDDSVRYAKTHPQCSDVMHQSILQAADKFCEMTGHRPDLSFLPELKR